MVRTCAVGLLLAVSVQAADEPKRAPATWVRTAGDFELTFIAPGGATERMRLIVK